jgi:hypothetical protein
MRFLTSREESQKYWHETINLLDHGVIRGGTFDSGADHVEEIAVSDDSIMSPTVTASDEDRQAARVETDAAAERFATAQVLLGVIP